MKKLTLILVALLAGIISVFAQNPNVVTPETTSKFSEKTLQFNQNSSTNITTIWENDITTQAKFNQFTVIKAQPTDPERCTFSFHQSSSYGGGARCTFHTGEPPLYEPCPKPNNKMNEWLITPAITVTEAGWFALYYKLIYPGAGLFTDSKESVDIYMGTTNTVAGLTRKLVDHDYVGWDPAVTEENFRLLFYVEAAGSYHFGFHCYSGPPEVSVALRINNVKLETAYGKDLGAAWIEGPTFPIVGKPSTFNVVIYNYGGETPPNYIIQLKTEAGAVVGTANITNNPIPSEGFKWFTVNYTPTTAQVGLLKIRAVVVLDGDENPANDASDLTNLEVIPDNKNEVREIGEFEPTYLNNIHYMKMPFTFKNNTSTFQTLYFQEELEQTGGLITKIAYSYETLIGVSTPRNIKIYMANTDKTTLGTYDDPGVAADWIPMSQFQLVYTGTVTVPLGAYQMILTLDVPFFYTGKNVAIMTEKVYANNTSSPEGICAKFSRDIGTVRALGYESGTTPCNLTQAPQKYAFFSDIKMVLSTNNGGIVQGKITNSVGGANIVNATVYYSSLMYRTSDNNGNYKYEFLPTGTHTLTAKKHGFYDKTISNINVTNGGTTTTNFAMDEMPKFTVSGTVITIDGDNLVGAIVKLSGYDNYQVTTTSTGTFSIPGVYKSNGYTLTVQKEYWSTFTYTFNVNLDTVLNITVTDDLLAPFTVNTVPIAENKKVQWTSPHTLTQSTYILDDGTYEQSFCSVASYAASMGNIFNNTDKGMITSVDILSQNNTAQGGRTVSLDIYDADKNLVTTSPRFTLTGGGWKKVTFPNIPYEGTFYALVHWYSDAGLTHWVGFDQNGPNANAGFAWRLDGGQWIPMSEYYPAPGVFCIRVNVVSQVGKEMTYGTKEYANTSSNNKIIPDLSLLSNGDVEQSIFVDNPITETFNSPKNLQGYKVWRLLAANTGNEATWTLLTTDPITATNYTDAGWYGLTQNKYKYAVKTVYTNNNLSPASFSEDVERATRVTVNVNTNTPTNESEGAEVMLVNNDGIVVHQYKGIVAADGKTIVYDVWPGTYTVAINLTGFSFTTLTNVAISGTTQTLTYTLTEVITTPYNLSITRPANPVDRLFSWNKKPALEDGFEAHPAFTVNSPGALGWNYIDADNTGTFGFMSPVFPNMRAKMAAIIFNPSQTDPPMERPEIQPRNGNQLLAFFGSEGEGPVQSNNWFITPELSFDKSFTYSFWGKTYVGNYGPERINVLYSTTGKAQADFKTYLLGSPTAPAAVPNEWTQYSFTLPANVKYVAIQHVSFDIFIFLVEDVYIGEDPAPPKGVKYEITLDGTVLGETLTNSYTFPNVSLGSHIAGVKAIFSTATTPEVFVDFTVYPYYTITPSASSNGTITPSTLQYIDEGVGEQRFTFKANTNYKVDEVLVDGFKVDSTAGYTFRDVYSNRTIHVNFKSTIGIKELSDLDKVSAYSNNGKIYIVNNDNLKLENIAVIDILGREVYSKRETSSSLMIDVPSLSGIYFVRLTCKGSDYSAKLNVSK